MVAALRQTNATANSNDVETYHQNLQRTTVKTSLDLARLENVKHLANGSIRAACPACRAAGSDKTGEHLLIQANGKFGCAVHPNDPEHRKKIYKMAGSSHSQRNGSPGQIVATYDYHDRNGKTLFQVVRYDPKDFRQRRPDGNGGWIWSIKGIEKVLFRLPEILSDVQSGKQIFLCEGEKDVLAMVKKGFSATCNPMGAKKWQASYSETLRGAVCIIIADKDMDGRDHAQLVASKLYCIAKSVSKIELPDVNGQPVKDASDFFNAGGDAPQIQELLDAAPEFRVSIKNVVTEPDESPADMRGEILSILTSKLTPSEQRTKIANAVVLALAARGQFFFNKERKDFGSAMYFDGQRKELLRIRSDDFLAWLAEWVGVNKADSVFKFIHAQVETSALASQHTRGILPESFWASRKGVIYLSNGNGHAARITAGKVEIVDNGADGVLFAAGNTLAEWELTEPKNPFETCALFSGANCAATHGIDLLRLFIFSLPTNPPSKPPLCFAGDIGSGKTRLAKGIAELYGLPFVANKIEDFGEDNFWVSLDGGGLFILDNCDTRNRWLADAVASAATDGCKQNRKLYTNSERVTFRARAWLALTTANPTFASDSGLADRLLLVRMNRRTDETSDATLSDEIQGQRSAGLSFIARTLATALADTEKTPAGLNQRHPDFASFAVRIGRATGREAETIHALKSAEHDKSLFCLENDTVATALLSFLACVESFTGTAAELCVKLIETDKDLADKLSARGLGKRLSALMPHLQKVLANAKQQIGRSRVVTYAFKSCLSGGCGEFKMSI